MTRRFPFTKRRCAYDRQQSSSRYVNGSCFLALRLTFSAQQATKFLQEREDKAQRIADRCRFLAYRVRRCDTLGMPGQWPALPCKAMGARCLNAESGSDNYREPNKIGFHISHATLTAADSQWTMLSPVEQLWQHSRRPCTTAISSLEVCLIL